MPSDPVTLPPVDGLHTTEQAATVLGVPAARIRRWRSAGLIAPAGMIPGRGRGGLQAVYYLAELTPLADAYHRRHRRDTEHQAR